MSFNSKISYLKINEHIEELNKKQQKIVHLITNNNLYYEIFENSDYNYFIYEENNIVGFFSLSITEKIIILNSLYVCSRCRNRGIATEVMNDIVWAVKYNISYEIECMLANTFVESAMFFFKKGFDFCKRNKKLDYTKKNIIMLYKRI